MDNNSSLSYCYCCWEYPYLSGLKAQSWNALGTGDSGWVGNFLLRASARDGVFNSATPLRAASFRCSVFLCSMWGGC
jgi:hypothetical protein